MADGHRAVFVVSESTGCPCLHIQVYQFSIATGTNNHKLSVLPNTNLLTNLLYLELISDMGLTGLNQVTKGLYLFLEVLRVHLFFAYLGYQQNSVPCDCRTENSIFLLAVN